MLRTLREIKLEISKCHLLYEIGQYDAKTYADKLKYLNDCSKYIKHYNKLYSNYSKYGKKTKTKTK